MKKNKCFTLAEFLIVVAIIGVLVAISIPIFNSQLEKSRDAVSVANIRAAYAQAQTAILTKTNSDADYDGDVKFTKAASTTEGPTVKVRNVAIKSQKANNWSDLANELPWINGTTLTVENAPADGGKADKYVVTFKYDSDLNITEVSYNAD